MKTRSILLASALMLSACGNPNSSKAQDGVFAESNRVTPESAGAMKSSFAPVVRTAAPAVVNISTKQTIVQRQPANPFSGTPFGDLFGGMGGGQGAQGGLPGGLGDILGGLLGGGRR